MAQLFDQATISRVQQASDIVEVISEHLTLTKKGREMVGLCPFHEDHKPSMFVNPTKQIFKCFACGAGGNVFSFLQMREGLTFGQAVERLAQRAHIEIKATRKFNKTKTQNDANPNELSRVNTWADKFFQKHLNENKNAKSVLNYLYERKISNESIKKWHIGYSPPAGNELVTAAKRSKIPDKLLSAAGLVRQQAFGFADKFTNRLMFVITDVTGRVIGFGGRTLDGQGAKYINSPNTVLFDKSNCMYGLQQSRDAINKTETAVVVEGYTDVIMAHQFGIENVVATLGTSFTEGHARILKRYAKNIILVFDSDTAGVEAANRALEICLGQRIDIKMASIPEGKDPCDYLLDSGKDAFKRVLNDTQDVIEFKWQRLLSTLNSDDTIAGRKSAINEFITSVAKGISSGNMDVIEKGIIVNRIAKLTRIDTSSINNELNRKIKAAQRSTSYNLKNQKVVSFDIPNNLFAAAQTELIEVLLNKPKLFKVIKKEISPKDFDVPALAMAAEIIFEALKNNKHADFSEILAYIEDTKLAGMVVKMQQQGQEKENYEKRLADSLDVFRRCLENKGSDTKSDNLDIEDLAAKAKKKNPYSLGMR